jgi:2-C-methyl-D-erythritol 4-phosphate cytidylyltransferase
VPKLYAVVPASGVGTRMQADRPKQYLTLLNATILEHTLNRLLAFSAIEKIIVVVSPEDKYWPQLSIRNHPKIDTCHGGAQRYHSVLNGLKYLKNNLAIDQMSQVMVHDAARPCIKQSDLQKLLDSACEQGSLLGLQVRDTMKRTNASGHVLTTVVRNNLWHALTPQMAPLRILQQAIQKSLDDNINITDEASALEHFGLSPKMIAADPSNIKITQPDDLALAEAYLLKENL